MFTYLIYYVERIYFKIKKCFYSNENPFCQNTRKILYSRLCKARHRGMRRCISHTSKFVACDDFEDTNNMSHVQNSVSINSKKKW